MTLGGLTDCVFVIFCQLIANFREKMSEISPEDSIAKNLNFLQDSKSDLSEDRTLMVPSRSIGNDDQIFSCGPRTGIINLKNDGKCMKLTKTAI